MKFRMPRDVMFKVLQQLSGVVERRQTLPILGNILVKAEDELITLVSTDLEVELIVKLSCEIDADGETTIPAKKWLDICKNLPNDVTVTISQKDDRVTLQAGRSRFTLSTLPSTEFPMIEEMTTHISLDLKQDELKAALNATHFSMAYQDVRYYLNGLMMEMTTDRLRSVATDGHRLAMKDLAANIDVDEEGKQVIVPRKGVLELMRLLCDSDDEISVIIGSNHIRLISGDMTFTSKLVDGRFPDYQRVMPEGGSNILLADKEPLRQTLTRVAILSNEKYRGIRMILRNDNLQFKAHNPEQEEAEDEINVEYSGDELEMGFNANYLLDAVNAVTSEQVKIILTDSNSSCLIQASDDDSSNYVVMPMRL